MRACVYVVFLFLPRCSQMPVISEIQEGLRVLEGCEPEILRIIAGKCETRGAWAGMLGGILDKAMEDGEEGLAIKLVWAGARVTRKTISLSGQNGMWKAMPHLLQLGDAKDLGSESFDGTMCLAISHEKTGVVRQILAKGIGPKDFGPALVSTVKRAGAAAEEILKLLLAQPRAYLGLDFFENMYTSPLMLATKNGLGSIYTTLLHHGASVNGQLAANKWTPLFVAARALDPCIQTTRILLAAGADPNRSCSPGGTTPMQSASGIGNPEMIKVLIEHGGDVNARDVFGDTPLCTCVWCWHTRSEDAIELLVNAGADMNAQNARGYTALHIAACGMRLHAARKLLELGADETIRDNIASLLPIDVVGEEREHINDTTEGRARVEELKTILHRAPLDRADRAWGRRSCVNLCRARVSNLVGAGNVIRRRRYSPRLDNEECRAIETLVCDMSPEIFRMIVAFL